MNMGTWTVAPEATVTRLPLYYRALLETADHGVGTVSSQRLAELAGVNAAKVRKDLSYLGSYGTRGVGYDVDYLRYQIAREIGVTQDWPVVIVGIGNLGVFLRVEQLEMDGNGTKTRYRAGPRTFDPVVVIRPSFSSIFRCWLGETVVSELKSRVWRRASISRPSTFSSSTNG